MTSRRHKMGRVPTIISADRHAELAKLTTAELVSLRADLGSLMHVHGATVNKMRVEAESITAILRAREKPDFEVTDHAVVRWLEKVKGMDMSALRQEIAASALRAKNEGGGEVCRAKGDAVAYSLDDITYVVARGNAIVTVVFGPYVNPFKREDSAERT